MSFFKMNSAKFGGNKHYCCFLFFCFGEVYKSLAIIYLWRWTWHSYPGIFFLNDPVVLEKKIVYPNNDNDDIQEISFSFDGNSSKWLHMKIYNIHVISNGSAPRAIYIHHTFLNVWVNIWIPSRLQPKYISLHVHHNFNHLDSGNMTFLAGA